MPRTDRDSIRHILAPEALRTLRLCFQRLAVRSIRISCEAFCFAGHCQRDPSNKLDERARWIGWQQATRLVSKWTSFSSHCVQER